MGKLDFPPVHDICLHRWAGSKNSLLLPKFGLLVERMRGHSLSTTSTQVLTMASSESIFHWCQNLTIEHGFDQNAVTQCIADRLQQQQQSDRLNYSYWLLTLTGAMVFIMQVGFAMLCAGKKPIRLRHSSSKRVLASVKIKNISKLARARSKHCRLCPQKECTEVSGVKRLIIPPRVPS